MKWTMTCDAGHEAESWDVEAATKDEAYDEFMKMPACQQHAHEKHPDSMHMDPVAMKAMMMDSIQPVA